MKYIILITFRFITENNSCHVTVALHMFDTMDWIPEQTILISVSLLLGSVPLKRLQNVAF